MNEFFTAVKILERLTNSYSITCHSDGEYSVQGTMYDKDGKITPFSCPSKDSMIQAVEYAIWYIERYTM